MSRFYQIRRMRGAAFLILTGVLALLNQWHTLSWSRSWPLYVILLGVLILAERAAWTADVRDRQASQKQETMNPGATPSMYTDPTTSYGAGTGFGGGPETIQTPPPENPKQEER